MTEFKAKTSRGKEKGFLSRFSAYDKKKSAELILICLPAILKVFIFSYIPMVGIIMAFQNFIPRKGLLHSTWMGFSNFEYLLKSSTVTRLITNEILLNVLIIVFTTAVSLLLGLFLFEVASKSFVKIAQIVIIFPYFASWPLVDVLLSSFIGTENGMLTKWIEKTFSTNTDIYSMPQLWRGIITFANVWKTAGLSAVVYYAVLLGVDKEVYEAAGMDGAGRFRTMVSISLPYLKQMVVLNTIMSSANILRIDFNMVYFLTENKAALYPTTDVIETYMFRILRTEGDVSVTAATGLVQGVIGLILTLILNALSKKTLGESLY